MHAGKMLHLAYVIWAKESTSSDVRASSYFYTTIS